MYFLDFLMFWIYFCSLLDDLYLFLYLTDSLDFEDFMDFKYFKDFMDFLDIMDFLN